MTEETQTQEPATGCNEVPCPNHETLSVWFDGEGTLTPEQKQHVMHCRKCQDYLRFWCLIGPAVSHTADGEFDLATQEHILTGTRRMIVHQMRLNDEAEKKSFRQRLMTPKYMIRLFILLIFFVILLFLLFRESAQKKAAAIPLRSEPEISVTGKIQINSARPLVTGPADTVMSSLGKKSSSYVSYQIKTAFTYTGNPLEKIAPGSFFAVYDISPSGVRSFTLNPPGYFLPHVEQYWLSLTLDGDHLTSCLSDLCTSLGIDSKNAFKVTQRGKSYIHFSGKLNARQAALLLKQLHAWGLTQVSAAQPYPDQNFFCGTGLEPVQFTLHVILREQPDTVHMLRSIM